jgi:polyhydroxyalkanoate synthesis regulator phasin
VQGVIHRKPAQKINHSPTDTEPYGRIAINIIGDFCEARFFMNTPPNITPEAIFQLAQRGFRLGLGATSTAIEGLQNPQGYQQTIEQLRDKIRTNPNQLVEELTAKGEVTEREARKLVDQMIGDRLGTRPASEMTVTTTAVTIGPDVEAELQNLTQQLVALRQELQQLKTQRDAQG